MAVPSSVLKVEEIQGRGRGIVASQPLKAGQIILTDSPILLYPTTPFSHHSSLFCDHCFKSLHSSFVSCSSCNRYRFCNSTCLSKSLNSSHSTWVCQALSQLQSNPLLLQQPLERQLQARFLIAAYNLAITAPSNFQVLLSLQGSPDNDEAANFLHHIIASLFSHPHNELFSLQLTSSLLAKDKLNAFGLMHPFSETDENRSVRAYGIYPYASFFNHDCLPNACRFDYVDVNPPYDVAAGLSNTDFVIRMIHDVPQGREICLSYFPVNENYSSRQKRLLEDYGFACNCDRCNVESNWSDNESVEGNVEENEEEDMAMDDEEEEEEEQCENMEPSETDNNDFPHAYFFLKYMCDRTNCWGTLAPLPPQGDTLSNVMECNVCGKLKRDDDDLNVDDKGQSGEVHMED